MPHCQTRPLRFLRRHCGAWRRGLAGVGVAALMLGTAGTAFSRPPYYDQERQGRRQIEDVDRAEIRRSMGRPGGDVPPDAHRERRRMSEAERQSLRQAVREAYGDPRNRQRR